MGLIDFSTSEGNKGKQPPPLNARGMDPKERARQLKEWVDDGIYYDHPLRRQDMCRNRRFELFDQCIQWLQRAAGPNDNAGEYTSFVDVAWMGTSLIPTPAFNEGLGARQNESSRLARPNYRPVVKPKGDNPDLKTRLGCARMQDTLRNRLREMHASHDMAVFYYQLPMYGGSFLKSEMVQTWDKTAPVPVLNALKCPAPGCDFKLADPMVTPAEADKLQEMAPPAALPQQPTEPGAYPAPAPPPRPVGGPVPGSTDVQVSTCPTCPDHPTLAPFSPTLEEAGKLKDALGRPMGTEQPLADWEMSVRHDADVFPRNMGFDMKVGRMDEWTEVHVENLDWVALRYPDKVQDVKPENPAALALWHPVASMPGVYDGILSSARTFFNSVRIKERHKKPWMEEVRDPNTNQPVLDKKGRCKYAMNKGRSVVIAGDVVLLDSTYLFESSTKRGDWIERVELEYVVWEYRDGGRRARGLGLWDVMLDPQKMSNEIRSQTAAIRQRLAVPIYLTLKSHNFEIQAMKGGIPGLWASIDSEPGEAVMVPQLWNNSTIDAGVRYELEDAVSFLQRAGHLVEVERGQPPPGVSAASALELLKGAASEGREARLERIKTSLERLWQHGEKVIKAVYLEPREVKTEDEDSGQESWAFLQATDFASETVVSVQGEPDYDEKTKAIEVFRDMVGQGMFDPTQIKPRKLSKLMGGPEELWEKEDLQEEVAQLEAQSFKTEGRIPAVDPGLDDHGEHFDEHGKFAMTEWFRDLEKRANWDGALGVLGGQWHSIIWSVKAQPYSFETAQVRLFKAWTGLLTQAISVGIFAPGNQPDSAKALGQVLWWRAHMAAHKIEEEFAQQMAQSGMAVVAQPGSPTTAAGLMPTNATAPVTAAAPAAAGAPVQ